jgi:hypothetical protein
MNPIGGYFELELRDGKEYYQNAFRLNTGRNALELILRIRQYKKVFIPYYTCSVLLEPFKKLKVKYEFYSIDEEFEPLFNFDRVNKNEGFLYTNYFGLKSTFISHLSQYCKNLIIDNSQAFFCKPEPAIDTFYSPRKYFGLSDGAYLFTNAKINYKFEKDISIYRFSHLIGRIENSAEESYSLFVQNDNSLVGLPIKLMSNLTHTLLKSIDYKAIAKIRRNNFNQLHSALDSLNVLKINTAESAVPMVYPFLTRKKGFRNYLIKNKIYVAQYWPNVLEWCKEESIENKLAQSLLNLPIDQRYSKHQMQTIIELILNYA